MADVIDAVQPPEVVGAGIAPPQTLINDFNDAKATGNSDAMYSLLTRAGSAPVATAIQKSAQAISQVTDPIQATLDRVAAQGGVGTRNGNLAAANAIQTHIEQQPETSILKGLAQGLMGDPNWRRFATQGQILPKTEFGTNGDFVTSYYADNNPNAPTRVVKNGQDIGRQDYIDGGYGRYNTIGDTPGGAARLANTKSMAETNLKEVANSNYWAAGYKAIGQLEQQQYNGWDELRKTPGANLSKNDMDEFRSFVTRTQGITSTAGTAAASLRSANDTYSRNDATDKYNKFAGSAGVPKIASINSDNSVKFADGTTGTLNDLIQKTNSVSSSEEQSKQWSISKQQLAESSTFKRLDAPQQEKLINIMNLAAAGDQMKRDITSKVGASPIFAPSIPFELGQSFKVGMENATRSMANGEYAEAYREFLDKARKENPVLVPGEAQAAFMRSQEFADITDKYGAKSALIRSMPEAQDLPEKTKVEAGTSTSTATPKKRSILPKAQGEERLTGNAANVAISSSGVKAPTGAITDLAAQFRKTQP